MATLTSQKRPKQNVFDQLTQCKSRSIKMTGKHSLVIDFTGTTETRVSGFVFGSIGSAEQYITQGFCATFGSETDRIVELTFDSQCWDYLTVLSAYNFELTEGDS